MTWKTVFSSGRSTRTSASSYYGKVLQADPDFGRDSVRTLEYETGGRDFWAYGNTRGAYGPAPDGDPYPDDGGGDGTGSGDPPGLWTADSTLILADTTTETADEERAFP